MMGNLAKKLRELNLAIDEACQRMVVYRAELPGISDSLKVTRLMRETRDLLNEYLGDCDENQSADTGAGAI